MRKLRVGIVALTALVLLAGCSKGKPLPSGMDEDALLSAGREVVALLVAEEYETVAEQFRDDVRQSTNAGQVEQLMAAAAEKAGAYRKEDSTLATGQTNKDSGERYGIAVILCKHEKKAVAYRVAFDVDLTLIGLSIEVK